MARFVRPTMFGTPTPRPGLRGAWGQAPGIGHNQPPRQPRVADVTEDAPDDGFAYGRMNAQWVKVVPLEGAQMEGPLLAVGDPEEDLEVSTKHYADNLEIDGGEA